MVGCLRTGTVGVGDTGLLAGMAPAAFDDFEVENLAYEAEHQQLLQQLLAQLQTEVSKWFTPNPPL